MQSCSALIVVVASCLVSGPCSVQTHAPRPTFEIVNPTYSALSHTRGGIQVISVPLCRICGSSGAECKDLDPILVVIPTIVQEVDRPFLSRLSESSAQLHT